MTDQELEKKIQSGFEKITPDVFDSVLKDCKEQDTQNGQILVMDQKRRTRPALRFAGIAAALLLLLGGYLGFRTWQVNSRVTSIISLDVNPSVEIRTNEKEKVLEVLPLNEDGHIIAGDMDFAGSSLDVTVNALVGSMLRNGYLSELANSILISIENDDPAAASALEQKMMAMVKDLLGDAHLEAAVLGQVVKEDKAAKEIAKNCGISVGKARLIDILVAADPKYDAEELSGLTINELNNLYAAHKNAAPESEDDAIDSIGEASTQAYIGKESAAAIALKDAGITDGSAAVKAELDWEDGRMVYEVEFETDRFEFEYDIDAKTGEILSVEKEALEEQDRDDDNDRDDHDEPETRHSGSDSTVPSSSVNISEAQAKQIALEKAGVSAAEITNYEIEFDEEDGRAVYEIEFRNGGYSHELIIDAKTGEVLEYERQQGD